MSEMNEMIIDSTTKIMEKYSTKEVINDAEKGIWAGELWNNLAEYGMLNVAVSEESGGSGGDVEDAFSILRLAGKYSAPIPLAETYIANWLLTEYKLPLPNKMVTIARGPLHFYQESNGWVVTGTVKNVPWGRYAEQLLVIGETSEGHILALLPLQQAKVSHGKNMAGEPRDQIIFDRIVQGNCKTIPIKRDEFEKKVLYMGALTKSVMMAGAIEKTLEVAITHSTERTQFGRPLHRFQAIQHHLAALAGEAASASIAANYAVDSYTQNSCSKEIALAKIRVNEAAGKASTIAHQILAAIGFTYEHTLHHSTRRLWSWRDEYGTEADWEQVLTEELLQLKKDGLWSMITGVENFSNKAEIR